MATTPGYQKREDGNVYYVIGGQSMKISEVLYKDGSALVLDAAEGNLNLKGRKVYINSVDISNLIKIIDTPGTSIATSKDIATAIETYKTNNRNAINANVDKVASIPKLAELSRSLNNFLSISGNTKNVPTNDVEYDRIDPLDVNQPWTEETIVNTINQIVNLLNAFFEKPTV